MTVYVVGGDHYDAEMGVKMLGERGIAAQPLAIADSPEEYMLRAQDHAALQEHVFRKIAAVPARVFVVFCNTLSFAMDWDMLSHRAGVPVVSLMSAYRQFIADFRRVAVIAVHEHTLHNIRRFLDREHGKLATIGFSMMPLVESVEQGADHINATLGQLAGVSAGLGAEAFVLGCTHFEDCVVENAAIQVVYPGKILLDYVIGNGYV